MKEIRHVIAAYHEARAAGVPMALATVVGVERSSYRRKGARMLVRADGLLTGGISGGCLEGDALRRAQRAIHSGRPSLQVYDTLDGEDRVIGIGLGCNGRIEVLFQPLTPEVGDDYMERLAAFTESREPVIFRQRVAVDGHVLDLAETIRPETRLLVIGDNYDTLALAEVAAVLGWEIHCYGTVRKFTHRHHELAATVNPYAALADGVADDYTAVVLMTHDYARDLGELPKLLSKPYPYVGLLGPRARARKLSDELGVELLDRSRVFAPVGLDIGAESPEEIALAVAAEVTAVLRGRAGMFLRERAAAIHEPPLL